MTGRAREQFRMQQLRQRTRRMCHESDAHCAASRATISAMCVRSATCSPRTRGTSAAHQHQADDRTGAYRGRLHQKPPATARKWTCPGRTCLIGNVIRAVCSAVSERGPFTHERDGQNGKGVHLGNIVCGLRQGPQRHRRHVSLLRARAPRQPCVSKTSPVNMCPPARSPLRRRARCTGRAGGR
jgi:hypothetical protein